MKLALRLFTILAVAAGALVATTSPAAAITLCGINSPAAPSMSGISVFWAANVDCQGTYTIHIRTNLYKIVGSGDNQSYVWVDYSDGTVTSTSFYLPRSRACNGSASTSYIFDVYAYVNGDSIGPRWSGVGTLPCGV